MDNYLCHIKKDLEMELYKWFEGNEEDCFRCLDTREVKDISKIIKNLSEAIYYDTIVDAMHNGTVDPRTKTVINTK